MEYKNSSRKSMQKRNFGEPLNNGNRMRQPLTQQAAYGQPAIITNSQYSNRRFDASQSNRYAGPLREFSNQLPVRLSQPVRRCSPLHTHRYGAPALLPLWSKSNAQNNNNHNNGFSSRPASRKLDDMNSEDWTNYMSYANNTTSEAADSMIKVQDHAWKSFVERDNYMDEVKKYNSSNLNQLKSQRDAKLNEHPLSEFDDQILACVANPGKFWATWKLLEMIYDKLTLKNYVENRKYTEAEFESGKFSQELLEALPDADELEVNEEKLPSDNESNVDKKCDRHNDNNADNDSPKDKDGNNDCQVENDDIANKQNENDVESDNQNENDVENGNQKENDVSNDVQKEDAVDPVDSNQKTPGQGDVDENGQSKND